VSENKELRKEFGTKGEILDFTQEGTSYRSSTTGKVK
jgi:hypothetical protein